MVKARLKCPSCGKYRIGVSAQLEGSGGVYPNVHVDRAAVKVTGYCTTCNGCVELPQDVIDSFIQIMKGDISGSGD